MTGGEDRAARLRALLGPLDRPGPVMASFEHIPPLVQELITSYLQWEAPGSKVSAALRRLCGAVVDANELRVCLPKEIAGLIGVRYPRSYERAHRLRATLNDVYEREHEVTLECLRSMSKREAKEYLQSLEGMPGFVASRMMLAVGGHAVPLDERLLDLLRKAGVFDGTETVSSASAWLERQFRASETPGVYYALEAWASGAGKRRRGSRGRAGARPEGG